MVFIIKKSIYVQIELILKHYSGTFGMLLEKEGKTTPYQEVFENISSSLKQNRSKSLIMSGY
jgi:hypothetical protein